MRNAGIGRTIEYAGLLGLTYAAISLVMAAEKIKADIFYVNPGQSIQAVIDDPNVVAGDVIIANPGRYTGDGNRDIDFKGKAITLRSVDPEDPDIVASTIIDSNGTEAEPHRGFYFHSWENSSSVLSGFTITGGYASGDWPENKGGGIQCFESSPIITNCIIRGNIAWEGGGMYNYNNEAQIINCTLSDNFSYNNGGRGGGGGSYNATFDHLIKYINCKFIGNNVQEAMGGGMFNYGSDPEIINCEFSGNKARLGGGLANHIAQNPWNSSDPYIVNCTFTGNKATHSGGGIYNSWCFPTIINSILWENSAPQLSDTAASMSIITYSNIQGGWPGFGNIDADPLFVDPGHWDANGTPSDANDDFWVNGDYHLMHNSPCIDAGDPDHPLFPIQTDIDGQPRIMDGRVDMGIDEFEGYSILLYKIHNITQDTEHGTIQDAIDDANTLDEIVVHPYVYFENINFNGKDIILRSTAPTDLDIVAMTVIDGSSEDYDLGSVVTFSGAESPDCLLSGFTITKGNGNGIFGGGICGNGSLATIEYNIITRNFVSPSMWPHDAFGGGLYDCDGIIQYNLISGNRASGNEGHGGGGGLYGCDGIIQYNIISGNDTGGWWSDGAGFSNCNAIIRNNTIIGNGATANGSGSGGGLSNCNGLIIDNIIWKNIADNEAQSASSSTPAYSCIQDWTGSGVGNISEDPCFVSPGYWDDKGTPNHLGDDSWIEGDDYHLKSQGWRWNSKWKEWDFDRATSRCIDAGNPGSSLANELLTIPDDPNNQWGVNKRINMGAYGGTEQASMPPYDWTLLADMTNDGKVNSTDFAYFAAFFGQSENESPADFNRDGDTNWSDLAFLTNEWLAQTSWHNQTN